MMNSSGYSLTPGIARRMTDLLDRTPLRRTFSRDSLTSISSNSKPAKVDDLLAERSKLQNELDQVLHDCKVAEEGKAEAERQLQVSLQHLAKERQVTENSKAEKEEARKEAGALKDSLDAAEGRVAQMEVSLKEMDRLKDTLRAAEERTEQMKKEGQVARERLEQELAEVRSCLEEMKEKLNEAERNFSETERAKTLAITEAEETKEALEEAIHLAERHRTTAEQIGKEKSESDEAFRKSLEHAKQELESTNTVLGDVERRLNDERDAREKAEKKAMHDSKIAEEDKVEAERRLQDSLRLLAKERQASKDLKLAKDDAMRWAETSRNALRKAEEQMEEKEKEFRGTQERLERDSSRACRLAEQMKEKLGVFERELANAKSELDKTRNELSKAKSKLDDDEPNVGTVILGVVSVIATSAAMMLGFGRR
ncbi:hypothetical protein F5880DRAFT_778963 [Lentinula raphanica]|nr:hypothetical protein F5880DRAFT_778963 [Lentinula raphanica]